MGTVPGATNNKSYSRRIDQWEQSLAQPMIKVFQEIQPMGKDKAAKSTYDKCNSVRINQWEQIRNKK